MSERRTHRGSCHCGRVVFELDAALADVTDCNCSLCRRKGALWHGTSDANLRIVSGEADLTLYRFGTMTAKHYACSHCGVSPFTRPRLDPTRWAVNVRCLEDVDLSMLTIHRFDGEHREAAAKAFLARGR